MTGRRWQSKLEREREQERESAPRPAHSHLSDGEGHRKTFQSGSRLLRKRTKQGAFQTESGNLRGHS